MEDDVENNNSWSVMADKGYIGLQNQVRAVIPKRKPRERELTRSEKMENLKIASSRIIVENFFGRVCSLWSISHKTFTWNHDLYDDVVSVCFALTNYHILSNPLRSTDSELFCNIRKHYLVMARKQSRDAVKRRVKHKRRRCARISESLDVFPRRLLSLGVCAERVANMGPSANDYNDQEHDDIEINDPY